MTWTLVVLCTLAVAACTESDPPKEQILAACEIEATKVYPHWRSSADVAVDMGHFTELCMKAKGYDFADCQSPSSGAWINQTIESCYRKAKAN